MPRKKYIEPKSQIEAMKIIIQVWGWLIARNPAIMIPLTAYLLFGGGYFAWKNWGAETFKVEEAKPLSEITSFSVMPQAHAAMGGEPIIFNGKIYGYEDKRFVAKVRIDEPSIIVYDQQTKRVFNVYFNSQEDIRKQMSK